jgi:hypothetical protein
MRFLTKTKQAETSRVVYDMVVANKLLVPGFHYPSPGLGHTEKDGTGYREIPATWNPSISVESARPGQHAVPFRP